MILSNVSTVPVQRRTRTTNSSNWDIAFNKLSPKNQGHISFNSNFLDNVRQVCETNDLMIGICTTSDGVYLLALNREYYNQEVEANPDLKRIYFKAANRITGQQMIYDFVLDYLNRNTTETHKFKVSPLYENTEGLTFVDQIPTQAIYQIATV